MGPDSVKVIYEVMIDEETGVSASSKGMWKTHIATRKLCPSCGPHVEYWQNFMKVKDWCENILPYAGVLCSTYSENPPGLFWRMPDSWEP